MYSTAQQDHCGNHMENVQFNHLTVDGFTFPDLPKVFNKTDRMFLVSLMNETELNGPTENDKVCLVSTLSKYE